MTSYESGGLPGVVLTNVQRSSVRRWSSREDETLASATLPTSSMVRTYFRYPVQPLGQLVRVSTL